MIFKILSWISDHQWLLPLYSNCNFCNLHAIGMITRCPPVFPDLDKMNSSPSKISMDF